MLETHLLDKKFQEFWKCPEMISIYFCVEKLFISVQYQLLKDTFTIPTKIWLRKNIIWVVTAVLLELVGHVVVQLYEIKILLQTKMEIVEKILKEVIQRNQYHLKSSNAIDATYLFIQNITVNNICIIYNYIFFSAFIQHVIKNISNYVELNFNWNVIWHIFIWGRFG